MMRRLLCSVSIFLIPFPAGLAAQEVRVIDTSSACHAGCIHWDVIAHLRSIDEPGGGLVGEPRTLTMNSRGEFMTTSYQVGSEIQVFHPDGTFSRTIGRDGSGPGEFRHISFLHPGPGDSIWAFDLSGRVSILSPDLRFIRSQRSVGHVNAGVLLSDGSWILNEDVSIPGHRGFPLHHLSPHGEILKSFGGDPEEYQPHLPYLNQRQIAAAEHDCVWAITRTRYLVERWCVDGERHAAVERETDWFRPYAVRNPVGQWSSIQPWVVGVQEDSEGLLWVLTVVASSRWQELWDDSMSGTGQFDYRMFETVIEVLDPISGRLLASERIPERAYGFVGPLGIYTYLEDSSGQPSIRVLSLTLDRD